jgi:hypothetical protein
LVPSSIWVISASRVIRSTGRPGVYPAPPNSWTASVVTCMATSEAKTFADAETLRGSTDAAGRLVYPGRVSAAAILPVATVPPFSALSVVIPVYDEEMCIRPCVDALTAVAATGLPEVVVDDGSTEVGGSRDEIRTAAMLTPLFLPTFWAGVGRGLVLAAARSAP